MFVPVVITHAWSTSEGGYLHFTAIIPIKTVCKQFINGSVPFDYSLNSGFDTGMTADFAETLGRWAHLFRKCLRGRGWEWAQEHPSLSAGSRLLNTERKNRLLEGAKRSKEVLYFCILEHHPVSSRSRSLRLNPRATTDIVLTKYFK